MIKIKTRNKKVDSEFVKYTAIFLCFCQQFETAVALFFLTMILLALYRRCRKQEKNKIFFWD